MSECTYKQKGFLYCLTGLKFWECANPPPPTFDEARALDDVEKGYLEGVLRDTNGNRIGYWTRGKKC